MANSGTALTPALRAGRIAMRPYNSVGRQGERRSPYDGGRVGDHHSSLAR